MINAIPQGNVNDMEGMLNRQRKSFKPKMVCLEKSKTINIANNITQTGHNRSSENPDFSMEALNRKFLEGYVIDKNPFYNMENDKATFEMDYTFIKQ